MTIRPQLRHWSMFAATALLCGTGWSAPQQLTVAWRDKPPYHYVAADASRGFLLERAQQIFKSAGVPARFVSEPQKRIWANFQHGATNYCSISWYKLPEREAIAQYTQPIHEDLPHTILISPSAVARVRSHATLDSLLADPDLTLGVVDGVSYGPALDLMIKNSKNHVMSRTVETTLMMRMLTAGRASYMFVDREDWDFFRQKEKVMQAAVQYDLPGMPAGMRRHIVCSKDVPQETMDKLNKAIAATGGIVNPGHSVKQK
ncbi:substrate-binding periplasmic protein [Duganella sp. CT11-25]|uniref:substrate-binding periplasmic protein n=1 Tax=unclassified Duganella TaxID=2636909 RepID=UPI0039B03B74